MKSSQEWVIEYAGKPEENGSSIDGGQFDLLTTYPSLIEWIEKIQNEAAIEGLKVAHKAVSETLIKSDFYETTKQR